MAVASLSSKGGAGLEPLPLHIGHSEGEMLQGDLTHVKIGKGEFQFKVQFVTCCVVRTYGNYLKFQF